MFAVFFANFQGCILVDMDVFPSDGQEMQITDSESPLLLTFGTDCVLRGFDLRTKEQVNIPSECRNIHMWRELFSGLAVLHLDTYTLNKR